MSEKEDDKAVVYQSLCSQCQAGVMHLEYLTYFTWLDEELVSVPNFPAWVCDVCGKREYDARAIARLNTLLNHEIGRRSPHRRRPGMNRADQPRT